MSTVDLRSLSEGRKKTWAEGAMGRELTPELRRCVATLCATDAPYNLPLINDGWGGAVDYDINLPCPHPDDPDANTLPPTPAIVIHPQFILARMSGTMSTYDCSRLTDIVVAAHLHLVRVQFSAAHYVYERDAESGDGWGTRGFGVCTEIQLNARKPAGPGSSLYERHPDLRSLAKVATLVRNREEAFPGALERSRCPTCGSPSHAPGSLGCGPSGCTEVPC